MTPLERDVALRLSRRELRQLDAPGGMVRLLWRRLYRALRLAARAEAAQAEHDILYGTGTAQPMGVLHVRAPV